MARFKNNDEQMCFINDNNKIFETLVSQLPVDNQASAVSLVSEHYSKWYKMYNLPEMANPSDKINIELLYKDLKDSVQFGEIDLDKPIKMDTIEECIVSLLDLKLKEKSKECQIRLIQYEAGEVANKLRGLTRTVKNFETEIKKVTGYSVSYAYFLIKLYKACNKFTNLRYTTFSSKKLKKYFPELKLLMKADLQWWSLPRNGSTSTMNVEQGM